MSLRSKTQKAKKFGTPSAPSPTAQKPSPTSPRATGGTPSAPSPTAQPRTARPSPRTATSYGVTQTEAGQTAQTQFGTFTSNAAKTIIHAAFNTSNRRHEINKKIDQIKGV